MSTLESILNCTSEEVAAKVRTASFESRLKVLGSRDEEYTVVLDFQLNNHEIGYAQFEVDETRRRIDFDWFYPLNALDDYGAEQKRRGIATRALAEIVSKLHEVIGEEVHGYTMFHNQDSTSDDALNFFSSVGLDIGTKTYRFTGHQAFDDYAAKAISYAQQKGFTVLSPVHSPLPL